MPLPSQAITPQPRLAADAAPSLGQQVFERVCSVCHGSSGEGNANNLRAPALNASGYAWRYTDDRVRRIIQNGGRVMPPLADQLSDDEITAVIAVLQTMWTADQTATHEAVNRSQGGG